MNLKALLLSLLAYGIPLWAMGSPSEGTIKPESSNPTIQTFSPPLENLEALYESTEAQLQEIQYLMNQGAYGPAYKKALEVMSLIKQKSGVNPLAKFREKVRLSGVISTSDLRVKYRDLSNFKKEELARAVAGHHHGYYLHLLNLAKRARVIYVTAYYRANKDRMYQRELDKLKRDLVNIHNIPIIFQDSIQGTYMLFDMDVADEDIQISFNKEVLDTAIDVLGMTEQEFETLVVSAKQQKLEEHWRGIQVVMQKIEKQYKTYSTTSGSCAKGYVEGQKFHGAYESYGTYYHPDYMKCLNPYEIGRSYFTSSPCIKGYVTGRSYHGEYESYGSYTHPNYKECIKP
ncbi:MAG: hypothetical protein KDD61_06245 [Bdellovibrionales bacterium]|nr:hypothetical protein [Bdellovibrionales bacterium]